MGIVDQIKQRYRAEESLAYAGQLYSFALFFADSADGAMENRIRNNLQELALREDELDPDLRIEVEGDGGTFRMRITNRHGEERQYRFPGGGEPETALCWTIFGAATGAPWFEQLEGAQIHAESYHSDQQVLACALLAAANTWQKGVPAPGKILKEAVGKAVKDFVRQGPRLTLQPVSPEAWEPGNGLFPRTRSMQEAEVLSYLYGPEKFETQIGAYCQYIRLTPDYREALDAAAGSVRKNLYRQPISGLQNALLTAMSDYQSELSEELANRPSMKAQLSFSKLTPETVKNLLGEISSWYEGYLKIRVSEVFLQDLLDKAKEVISNEIRLARRAIQDMNSELRSFCKLQFGADIPMLDIGWNQSVQLQGRALQIPHTVWNVGLLHQLQLQGSISDFWLMSQVTADNAQQQFQNSSFAIPTLSDQTVIRLWKE